MDKKKITLEKKLEEVIVKDVPYDVPENWIWVKLNGGFADCLDKFRKPINSTERANRVGEIPYYGATGQVGLIDDYLTNENLVLLGEDGAPFFDILKNKAYIIDGKAWVNNHAHILKSYYGVTGNKYLMNYLNVFNYNDFVNGTTRLKLTQASMNSIPVPLPPLKEQRRIVDKIEILFEKLDRSKELIEEAREDFEKRKSAVLEKAFRGELTKEWRKNKGLTNEYKKYILKDLLKPMTNKKPDISQVNFRYIDIDAIDNKKQVVREPKIIETIKAPSRASKEVVKGDVLFSTVRPYLKNIAYITEGLEDCIASTGFYICRCNEMLDSKFLYRMLCSDNVLNYYTSLMKGDNSPSIRKGEFEGLSVNLPSLEEQKEIVRIIDRLLDEEAKIEELTQLEEQIELIKKSILAKAFRGQLGTNCEDDESALELLKEILNT